MNNNTNNYKKTYDFVIPLSDHDLLLINHDTLLQWIQTYYANHTSEALAWVLQHYSDVVVESYLDSPYQNDHSVYHFNSPVNLAPYSTVDDPNHPTEIAT